MMDNSSIPFDECLWDAYVSTTYRVLLGTEKYWDIRIGQFHPLMDVYLADKGMSHWVFVTAWNPHSRLLSAAENEFRNLDLLKTLQQSGLTYFPGLGIGLDGSWPAEESFWVAGVSREDALEWGKRWAQNAVVLGKKGGKAELLLTR